MADLETRTANQNNGANKGKKSRKKRKFMNRSQIYKEKRPKPEYQPIVKDNTNLVKYYKAQPIFEDGEFDTFMEGLRETLPASFRINTFDVGHAKFLRRLVASTEFEDFLKPPYDVNSNSDQTEKLSGDSTAIAMEEPQQATLKTMTSESRKLKEASLEHLGWYPNKLAWQFSVSRLDLKKSPILRELHKFLMAQTDNGLISRQEAVSMIPPLLLDIHHGQDVLDMCAAPGSKTAQLLEYLKCNIMSTELEQTKSTTSDPFDDGLVVANDVDNDRCYMLVHQSNRLNSPNCVIINEDASCISNLQTCASDDGQSFRDLRFDRILCDVPCSGDGTLRKNPDVWKKWNVGNANNFHGMQCKILRRGIELLKKDGLLVYSTCSMNPIEDEAVISSVLRAAKGAVVLEEVVHKLAGLKHRPGVSEWVVMNREMEIMADQSQVPEESRTHVYTSLFSPSPEEREQFKLHKCIRILPHFQNTGGFFVAVLKKLVTILPWEKVETTTGSDSSNELSPNSSQVAPKTAMQPKAKKRRFGGFKEGPFVFMDPQDSDWLAIQRVYGLASNFPINQLVHRSTSGKKHSIYLVSKRTRSFIIANREEPDRSSFVKIINAGMRLFSRAQTDAGFRICQDGVNEVLPFIKDDFKVPLSRNDLLKLLKTRGVPINDLEEAERIKSNIKQGSFIFVYRHEESVSEDTDRPDTFEVPIVAWTGKYTVALYVSKTYRVHLCALVKLPISEAVIDTERHETKVPEQQ